MGTKVTPYKNQSGSKKEEVEEMFDNIAHSYDFLNHFFSLGIDIRWRKKALKMVKAHGVNRLLDMATGTADFAILAAKMDVGAKEIIGVDLSQGMIDVGNQKVIKKEYQDLITLEKGDSENLRFPDDHFGAFTVGFGVRNYQNLEKGLAEMHRVLEPGGLGVILEFSRPKKFPMKQLFNFYFKYIMPTVGKLVSKDKRAYEYLPESVQAFPEGDDFLKIMEKCGYQQVKRKTVSGGIASIYTGIK